MPAIDWKLYDRLNSKEWSGKKVRNTYPITSGRNVIPIGTTFTIQRKYKGFDLKSDHCPHCGVQIMVGRVPPSWLELVDG